MLKKMGFRLARKFNERLRLIMQILAFGLPFLLLVIALLVAGWTALFLSVLAAPTLRAGMLVERWLFFA